MSERQHALRRTDLFGCGAMLLSGLFAQAAMWRANAQSIDGVAAVGLSVVSLLSAWRLGWPQRGSLPVRMLTTVARFAVCAAVFAAAITTGALVALKHGEQHPSTTAAVGAILLIVQVVQSASVTNRRDLALGAPVVCAMLTQAGMATHDARPAVPFVVSLVAMVVAIGVVHRGELLDETTVSTRSGNGAALLEAAGAPLVRVVIVAAVVFVLLPNSFQLAAHTNTAPSGSADGNAATGAGDPGEHSRALVDPSTGRLDLRVRGALSDTPIFVASASAPAYWQGAVYDHYDGVVWTMTGASPSSDWKTSPSTGVPVQLAPPDSEQPAGAQLVTRDDAVQVVSSEPPTVVFAPGRAVSYTGPGRVTADTDGNPRLDDVPAGAPSSHDYDVHSARPVLASGTAGAEIADARWSQVPAELPARVRQLGMQLAGHAANRADAVAAVDNYLRSNETYNLSAPLPKPGEDAVDDFLFVSHVGFCEQFASAAVMLLRSANIPARLVTGYAEGDVASEPGRRVMRGSDAHAWVQVWYPGTGWVDADPTSAAALAAAHDSAGSAGSPLAASPSSGRSSADSTADGSPSASASAQASASAAHQSSPASAAPAVDRAVAQLPGGRFALAVAIGLLAVLLRFGFAVGRRWVRRRNDYRGAPNPPGAPGGPILQAYLRLDAVLVAGGRAGAQGETPRELAARLDGFDYDPVRLTSAIGLLERECFDAEPPSRDDVLAAVAAFASICHIVRSTDAFEVETRNKYARLTM